jgi:Transglutaminase-like superfamily/Protein of unknown function (DUF1194)
MVSRQIGATIVLAALLFVTWSRNLLAAFECARLLAGSATEASDSTLQEIRRIRWALEDKLGIRRDPFVWATDVQSGVEIWNRLSSRFSPLLEVRSAVYDAQQNGTRVDTELEVTTLRNAEHLITDPLAEDDALAGAVKALEKLEQLHVRDLPPENVPEKQPPESKEKPGSEDAEKKKQKKKPEKNPPKNYKPHNKNTDGESNSTERVVIDPVQGWGQVKTSNPARVITTEGAVNTLTLNPWQQMGQVIPVAVPQGFIPVTFSDDHSTVFQDETGNYYYQTKLNELAVPLIAQGRAIRPLSVPEVDLYTAPSPISLSQWPEHLQQAIATLRSSRENGAFSGVEGDVRLAEVLGSYIANHFKYAVDADESQLVTEAAAKGELQCDWSAEMWALVLRNEFKIPCRVVGGYRGMKKKGMKDFSYVVSPATAHAWGEVPDALGNWHGVDSTPKNKTRQTKQDPAADDFSEVKREENQEPPQQSEENSQNMDGVPRDNSQDEGKTLRELIQEVEALQRQRQTQRRSETETAEQTGKETNEGEETPSATSGQNELETIEGAQKGNQDLITRIDERNPFILRLLKRLVLWAIDPKLSTQIKTQRLNVLKAIVGNDIDGQFPSFKRLKSVLAEATLLFIGDYPPFDHWIEGVIQARTAINELADHLTKIQSQIEFTLQFMEGDERIPLSGLLRALQNLRRELGRIKHKDSRAIRTAMELDEGLPGKISRRVIRDQYGIKDRLGDDIGTLKLAEAISQGKLNDYRLASLLGPHTEFLADPIPMVSRGERKTWDASVRPRGRREILMTSDPRQRNLIRLYDHLTDGEALARGQMGVLINRRRVPVPEGITDTNPEEVFILALDASGSMAGTNADFQGEFARALSDRALSDINPNGKPRRRVYVVIYGDGILSDSNGEKLIIPVTTAQEAYEVVRNAKSKFRNRGTGTLVKKTLVEIAALLKEANNEGDKPKSRATVVLCGDGQDNADTPTIPQVKAAFDAVGNKTDILIAFVAIGMTNPEFISLATKNMGAEKNMYIEWDSEDISLVMQKAKAPLVPVNDFWTNIPPHDWPNEIPQALSRLQTALGQYRADASKGPAAALRTFARELEKLSEIPIANRPDRRKGNHYGKLTAFRRVLNEIGPHLSPLERERILDQVLSFFPKFIPESMDQLDHQELAALHFIFQWPRTGATGQGGVGLPR